MARRWIQKALGGHPKGSLHRQLGIPVGRRIPVETLRSAAHHPERFKKTHEAQVRLARMARLALTLRGLRR